MTTAVRAPHPALRALLGPLVGYDEHTDPRAVHFGVPGPTATVILDLGDGLDVGWAGESRHDRFGAVAAGLHLRPSLIRTHGRQIGLQLALTPQGARALLGVPLGELASALVPIEDLPGPLSAALRDRLATAPAWEARFATLEDALLQHLAGLPERPARVPEPLAEAWRVLAETGGRARVADLAAHAGWSRRRFTDRFARELGPGPKQAARLVRLDTARRRARAGVALADVAVGCGFSDQAHLTREWRALTGRTPTADLAGDFPILQAGEPLHPGG